MDCPACNSATHVLETRATEGGAAVRRRRECKSCGRRFTSVERRERVSGSIRKRDGELQPFNAEKLRVALGRAAHKRDRFVTPADLDSLVDRIGFEAERAGELSSEQVRELCLDGLSALDTGAYLQFAGVELSDPSEVRATLDRLDARKDRDFSPLASVGSVRDQEDPKRPTPREQSRGDL